MEHAPATHLSEDGAATARRRPSVHFTAADGWINDPYGISWDGAQYHLFYQAIPGRVTWAPNCQWGHAISPDLVHWRELPLALVPQADEVGCWSGSALMTEVDPPTLIYTSIAGADWGQGALALAHADGAGAWTAGPTVIPGPPAELDAHAFRDPYVWRHGDSWRMLVAAGLRGDRGAAAQFSSPDLLDWQYDGILAERSTEESTGTWTGTLWECPQLFQVDGTWVLFVSVWNDDVLHYVAAATGGYDGSKFTATNWQRLTYGDCAYAMAGFADRHGRRCALSWLREEPQNDPSLIGFSGAHSVAATVATVDGRVQLKPHPDVLALAGEARGEQLTTTEAVLAQWDADVPVTLEVADSDGTRLAVACEGSELVVQRAGRSEMRLPWVPTGPTRIIVDADLVEIFGSNYGAVRLKPSRHTVQRVQAPAGECRVLRP